MTACHIYPVPANGGTYHWKWRSENGKKKSSRSFELFYDCVEDARNHGLDVDLDRAHNEIADAKINAKFVSDSQ